MTGDGSVPRSPLQHNLAGHGLDDGHPGAGQQHGGHQHSLPQVSSTQGVINQHFLQIISGV